MMSSTALSWAWSEAMVSAWLTALPVKREIGGVELIALAFGQRLLLLDQAAILAEEIERIAHRRPDR